MVVRLVRLFFFFFFGEVAVAFVPPSPQPRGFLHVVVVQQRRAQEVVVAEERPPPTTTSSMPPPPPPTMLFADECSSVDESDKERCLSSLSAKVQETLLASTLDIQVPGPGASREGSYFQGPPAKALKINLDILNYRAKRELKRGQVASARRLWQQCLEIDKYDGRAWLALSRDAEKTRRDPRLAAQYLLECLRYAPANAYVRQAYGILLERQGMRKQALEQYDRALAYDPSHAASWVAKARLLERRFRTPSYLAHDVLSDETDTETEPSRRRVYFSVSTKGDAEAYEEARRCYAQALRVDPTNGQALVASGMFEAGAGRVDAARRLFRRAVEANPRNAASYAAWAKVEEHERPRDARRFYAAAHAAHPSNTRALTSWARFELRQGNASAAVEILHKATRVRTGRGGYRGGCVDGDVFATLGEITWKHFGDARRARDAFRRAINVDASVPRAYLSWASMETRLGRLDFARDILQQGIWGVTTGVSDRRRVADLWRAAARVEVAAAKRGSFANATTVDAVRAAFREALDLVSQRADLASDGGKLAASVFLEWANFEALLPGGRHRQVLEDALHTLPNDPHLRSALETADRGPSSSSSASSSKRPATWGKAAVPNDAGRSPSGGGGA
ncbi:hypothetical protein CTAYLR_000470 [Chrysophaeum taylorii]|uniref:PsbB mRNA maturation factor Mbb1 n=1 Tax=Chrysophaeum taylorii TaxID=2483200 RepID=A0AAD7UGP8_9STRA|nr:hypothetical protein CTAYLR_000470 [Chrysophaeum taylorii]